MSKSRQSFSSKDLRSNATWNDFAEGSDACAARPVGTILSTHGCAVPFLDPSCGPAFDVGQSGVASTVLVWLAAGRVCGEVIHVGRFLRACAALGIPAGEHSSCDTSLWTRPLRYRLMQRWSFSHVDFCAGGARFRKRIGVLFIHCSTPSCRSGQCRSAHNVCTFTGPHQHWRNSRQNNQSSLAARMPQRIAVFAADCMRQSVIEYHRIQTFKSGQLVLGFGIYCHSHVMGWWWDLLLIVVGLTLSLAEKVSSSEFQSSVFEK